jgi:hypothetical protein
MLARSPADTGDACAVGFMEGAVLSLAAAIAMGTRAGHPESPRSV